MLMRRRPPDTAHVPNLQNSKNIIKGDADGIFRAPN